VGKFGKFNGFLTFFTVLLIMTGTVFAQLKDGISIGGGGKATFVPVQGQFTNDDTLYRTGVGNAGDPAKLDIDVTFSAADGRLGGQANLGRDTIADKQGVTSGDLNIWIKPFGTDILLLKIGKGGIGEFEGKVGTDPHTQKYIGGPGKGGGDIFTSLESGDGGAMIVSKPISGLGIFAGVRPGWKTHDGAYTFGSAPEAKDVYKSVQAGLAYNIAGIGLARAQWFGNTMNGFEWDAAAGKYKANNARIEAAFNLTAITGLNLDLGVKIPIPVKEEVPGGDIIYQDNFKLAVAGEFTAGDFAIKAGIYGAFGGNVAYPSAIASEKDKLSPEFNLVLLPSFYVAAIDSTIGADVGFKTKGESEYLGSTVHPADEGTTFGFGGWINKKFGNSSLKTGLFYQLPTDGPNGTQDNTSYLTWPIIVELSL
jgi:hypothetical protein